MLFEDGLHLHRKRLFAVCALDLLDARKYLEDAPHEGGDVLVGGRWADNQPLENLLTRSILSTAVRLVGAAGRVEWDGETAKVMAALGKAVKGLGSDLGGFLRVPARQEVRRGLGVQVQATRWPSGLRLYQ